MLLKVRTCIAQHLTNLNDGIAEATPRRIRNALHKNHNFITLDNLFKRIGVIGDTSTVLWIGWSKSGKEKWPIERQHAAEESASQRSRWHGQLVGRFCDGRRGWVNSGDKDTSATHWLGTSDLVGRATEISGASMEGYRSESRRQQQNTHFFSVSVHPSARFRQLAESTQCCFAGAHLLLLKCSCLSDF